MSRMEVGRAWRYSRYDDRNTACTSLKGTLAMPKTTWEFTCSDGRAIVAVAADTNLDGRMEVAAAGYMSLYLLMGATGKLVWEKPLTCHGRVAEIAPAAGVFDINLDGRPEIVVAAGNAGATAVSGIDGRMVWQHPAYGTAGLGFGILDNGARDVLQTDLWETKRIYRLRGRDGVRIWETVTPGAVYDLPVVADVNADGAPEVIFHSLCGGDTMRESCVCLGASGDLLWIREIQPSMKRNPAPRAANDASGAPVVVADFLGNGELQILLLTDTSLILLSGFGEILWQTMTGVEGVGQRTVRGSDGTSRTFAPPSQNAPARLLQGAAAGDIDGDGKLEVVIGLWPDYDAECDEDLVTGGWKACRYKNASGPRNSLAAFHGDTGELIWRYDSSLPCLEGGGMSAPIIADIDGDRRMEVAACSADGHIHAVRGANGSPMWQHHVGISEVGRLIFADINDDGFGELIAASSDKVTAVGPQR